MALREGVRDITSRVVNIFFHLMMGLFFFFFLHFQEYLYRVSHKTRNGGFSVHCEQKVVNIFTSLYKVSSAEENDT